ncbi:MAG: sulfotransferase, partial [Pseudomonadota bacterium]
QDFATGNAYANALDDIGHYYAQYDQLMVFWREHLGERLIEVDYESVVDDPETEIRRLLDHIGLAFDPRCLDPEHDPAIVSTMSRWQVRQPVYSRSVGRWWHYRPWLEPLAETLGVALDA